MGQCNKAPIGIESLSDLSTVLGLLVVAFGPANGSFGLRSCSHFDDVGDEQMAGNQCVKDCA